MRHPDKFRGVRSKPLLRCNPLLIFEYDDGRHLGFVISCVWIIREEHSIFIVVQNLVGIGHIGAVVSIICQF